MRELIIILFFLFSFHSQADEIFWNKSKKYFSEGKFKEADFYLALHLNHEIKDIPSEVPKVFQKLDERGLKPTSFIDGSYSQEFLMFFFGDTLFQWNSEIFDENNFVILTRIGKDEETGHYEDIREDLEWNVGQL